MFRCLLRVGQVVMSSHTLTKDSVVFTDYGFKLYVHSSKTSSRNDPPVIIPVTVMPNKRIHMCGVLDEKIVTEVSRVKY